MTPLFVDECCPAQLVKALRDLNYDVAYAVEDGPGLPDLVQARLAFLTRRVLVSADYGFGDLAIRHGEPFVGLVLLAPNLRLEDAASIEPVANRIHALSETLLDCLTIVERDGFRQRPF